MPYITQERRRYLIPIGTDWIPETTGELNYLITKLVQAYIEEKHLGVSYQRIAEVTGVLENVKQEFYRRVAVPYEEAKCQENGDVYV